MDLSVLKHLFSMLLSYSFKKSAATSTSLCMTPPPPLPSHPKDKIEVAVHPRLISSLVTGSAERLWRKKGPTRSPTALQTRPNPVSQRGHVALSFPPFFRGPAVVWVRRALWCCCYKYAAPSPSKWQLYSGARTRCLGAVGASRSKKGKPSVAALVDMYLCTWAVDVWSDGSFRLWWSALTYKTPPC